MSMLMPIDDVATGVVNRLFIRALASGLLIACAQLFWVSSLAPGPGWSDRRHSLHNWDGDWYESIASQGYVSTVPPVRQDRVRSNVAFFPGFPMFARFVARATRLNVADSLILAAFLANVGFWTTYLLIMGYWQVSARLAWVGVIAILTHYAAFYLSVGYSEGLFLWAMLVYLWQTQKTICEPGLSGRKRVGTYMVAALAGMVMTATRATGLALVPIPILYCILSRYQEGARFDYRARMLVSVALCGFTFIGAAAFFVFCQVRWGAWDLYFQTQRIGWNFFPSPLKLISPSTYFGWLFTDLGRFLDFVPGAMNRVSASLILILCVSAPILEIWTRAFLPREDWKKRVPLYLAAAGMFFLTTMTSANVGFDGMSRYSLPPFVLFVIAAMQLLEGLRKNDRALELNLSARLFLLFWFVISLSWQVQIASRFLAGRWME